jgi:tRNA 2-selenouridine synthase
MAELGEANPIGRVHQRRILPVKSNAIALSDALGFDTVLDARSPAEYAEDHVPGAESFPVLSNEERARVGTIYKQESPFAAKKLGAALVARNIAAHIEHSFADKPKTWRPLVYCWRGGKRSGAFAHILREIGWDAKTLEGGYKSYRRHVVDQLAERHEPPARRAAGRGRASARPRGSRGAPRLAARQPARASATFAENV